MQATSDYLDLRELAEEYVSLKERVEAEPEDGYEPLDEDEQERFALLKALESEVGGDLENAADNEPSLIAKSEFQDYCQELAEDCGYLSSSGKRDSNPLLNYIDWEAWARDCAFDYSEVDFDGRTYMWRGY